MFYCVYVLQSDTNGYVCVCFFFFQAEDGIRYLVRSRGLGDVYKRQLPCGAVREVGCGALCSVVKGKGRPAHEENSEGPIGPTLSIPER